MRFASLKTKGLRFMVGFLGVVLMIGTYGKATGAEKFPVREIELIINFTPGGSTDIMARIVGDKVSKNLGVPVVFINKAGGSGAVAASYVATAKPDGYTIGTSGASNLGSLLATEEKVPYTLKEFSGIARAVTVPMIFVTKKGRFNTLEDLIKESKQKPGTLTYGSWGAKSTSHLVGEQLCQVLGIKLRHVPFAGGSKQLAAVLGGHVDMIVSTMSTSLPNIKGGNLTCLAISTLKRAEDLSDVPTLKELGYGEASFESYDGFVASAKLPKDRLAIINGAFEKSIKDPEVQEALKKGGMVPAYLNGEDYEKFLADNLALLKKIAVQGKIKE